MIRSQQLQLGPRSACDPSSTPPPSSRWNPPRDLFRWKAFVVSIWTRGSSCCSAMNGSLDVFIACTASPDRTPCFAFGKNSETIKKKLKKKATTKEPSVTFLWANAELVFACVCWGGGLLIPRALVNPHCVGWYTHHSTHTTVHTVHTVHTPQYTHHSSQIHPDLKRGGNTC